jgi:ribonucleoside-diphosphate reductase beta chain
MKRENMLQSKLTAKLLYNPSGDDSDRKMIKGNSTNLLNLYDIKYTWSYKIWETMLQNHWIPEKSPMGADKESFKKLTEDEQDAYLKITSFLIFLDSLQTNNVPNITQYITAPEVTLPLSRQTFDEALHSRSYGHILTSIFNKDKATKAIYYWRDNEILAKRNNYIAKIYQDFNDNPTDDGLIQVIVANYLLEGLYFYNGFQFFYNLESRHLMSQTAVQIRYINRDEIQHCNLFKNIIKTIKIEEPELWARNEEKIYEMFRVAVEQEIEFSNDAIGDKILGMNKQSIYEFTHFMGNRRLSDIGLEKRFEKFKNPYEHLERIGGVEDESSQKENFFETQSIKYKQATILDGWDLL